MRLFVILSVAVCLTLASGSRLSAVKRRRESKWDIIHHEYHGPPAPLSKDGRVVDTAEVALARANHLAIHAETVIDLARKMAEAEAIEAKLKKEAAGANEAAAEWEGASKAPAEEAPAEEAPEAAPIVVEPVEMTPELMAMLMEAAAEEEQKKQEAQEEPKKEEAEAAPAAEEPAAEAPAEEAAPAEGAAEAEAPAAEAAPAAEPAAEAPAAEVTENVAEEAPKEEAKKEEEKKEEEKKEEEKKEEEKKEEEKKEEAKKEEETKPVVEPEAANEVDAEHHIHIHHKSYEGPLAPLGEDGRVLDTPEVRKAKEAHLHAYELAVKLAKAKDAGESKVAWYEASKRTFHSPPAVVHLLFHHDGPVGYNGPKAPIGKLGTVVDTEEVERARTAHRKAHEQAKELAKLHPPKAEDNSV